MEFTKKCFKCGGLNPDNVSKCLNCGGFLEESSSEKVESIKNEPANSLPTLPEKIKKKKIIDYQMLCFERSTRWLQIYIFAILPLRIGFGALGLLNALFRLSPLSNYGFFGIDLLLSLSDFSLTIITFMQMKNLKKAGYALNIAWLFAGLLTIVLPVAMTNTILGAGNFGYGIIIQSITYSLICIMPNWIYFYKRKALFNDPLNNTYPSQMIEHIMQPFQRTSAQNPAVKAVSDTNSQKTQAASGPRVPAQKITYCRHCGSPIDPEN